MKLFYVYILTNRKHKVLYTGLTNNLSRRLTEHQLQRNKSSFTYRYNINKLVFFETYSSAQFAADREKQIKAGSREKKITLIESTNPEWKDLRYEAG